MATKATAKKVPASPPVRLEVRLNGSVRFVDMCYNVQLSQDESGEVLLTASLKPHMVDAPTPLKNQKFGDDPRDGEAVIHKVHSGRRT